MNTLLPIEITRDKLEILFPFYFIIDSREEIVQYGPSFSKIIHFNKSKSFNEVFAFKRPKRDRIHHDEICQITNSVIILESKENPEVVLRGQFICFPDKQFILFAGSPWMTDVNDLEKLDLKITDFAIHNTITDMLQILKVKETVMGEVKMLVEDLTEQKNKLNVISNRLSALIQILHSGILLEDEERKIVLVNKEFCNIFSIPLEPDQMIGFDCAASLEQSKVLFTDQESFVLGVNEAIAKKVKRLEEILYLKNGNILQRDFIPIYQNEKYLGHLWIYTDVTAKVKNDEIIRKSEEKYKRIIENFDLGLLEVDNENLITKAYDGFCRMTGYKEAELIGINASSILSGKEYESLMKRENEKRRSGVSSVYEVRINTKSGQPIWVLISGTPIYYDKNTIIGSIGIYKDITTQKEREIRYKEAKDLAEESVNLKKQIIANVSHEVRTPIHAIKGLTEVLLNSRLNAETKEDLQSIYYSANHLMAIVQDLLEIAKIESGKNKLKEEKFDFKSAILKLAHNYSHLITKKSIKFDFKLDPNIPAFLIGDENKVVQVINNLLSNALKFTHKGKIEFHVLLVKSENSKVRLNFRIADTGIGIPSDKIKKVFESFVQANNDTSKIYGGTGLGLSITKSIVEQLNGSIEVTSKLKKGSIFSVEVPFQIPVKTEALNSKPSNKKVLSGKKLNVLVVEDNIINQKVIQRQLSGYPCVCKFASNGKQTRAILEKNVFDVVLMDIQLPGTNGYELTKWIRASKNSELLRVKIIGLSAHASASDKQRALKTGMNNFLSKPFTKNELLNLIFNGKSTTVQGKAQPESTASTNLVNWKYLDELSDDKGFKREMINSFIQTTGKDMRGLRTACEEKKHDNIKFLAHKIKGSVKIFEAKNLALKLKTLEYKSKDLSRQRKLNKALLEIEDLFKKVKLELKKERSLL